MGRIIVEQIISADGFAQDSDGGMKFMTVAEPDEVDDDQLRMLERVDAIVFGRVDVRHVRGVLAGRPTRSATRSRRRSRRCPSTS